MPRTVSATEAKNQLAALIAWASSNRDEVIVESHGEPVAALISIEEYESLKSLRERRRREEALAAMRNLRERVLAQNADLTPEEGDELADRFARDLVDNLVDRGMVRFDK